MIEEHPLSWVSFTDKTIRHNAVLGVSYRKTDSLLSADWGIPGHFVSTIK